MADLFHHIATNPLTLAYLVGCVTGWQAARFCTRYMLGFGR